MDVPVGTRVRVYTGRTVTADFKPNRRNVAKHAMSPALGAIVMQIVETRALPFVQAYSESFRDDGDYKRGLKTELTTDILPKKGLNAAYPMERVAARLLATAAHSIIVEIGIGGRQEAHHPLRYALEYIDATSHHF